MFPAEARADQAKMQCQGVEADAHMYLEKRDTKGLLDLVRAGGEDRDDAREAMVKIFAVLGDSNPLTADYRRKLAQALF